MQRLIAFPLHLEASRYPRRTGGRTNPLGQWTPATHHRRRSDWLGYGCTRRGPPGNYLRPQCGRRMPGPQSEGWRRPPVRSLFPRRSGGLDLGSRVPPATGAEPGGERVHTPRISGTYLGDTYLSARQHQNEPLDDVLPFFRLPSFVPDTCCEAQQTGSRRCPDMPSRQAPLSRRDCHCSQPGLEQRTDCSVLTHNVIRVPQMFNYSGDQAHFLKFMQTIGQHASRDYNECSSCDLEEPTEIQPDRPSEYCITQNYSQSQTGDGSNRSSARSGRCGEGSVEEESRLQPFPQDCNEGQKANSPPRTERGGTTHPILYVDAHLCGLTAHPEHHERKYRHSEEAGDPLNNLPNRFR